MHISRLSLLILATCLIVSIFLHFYQWDQLCLNEDEAAQGYNTYSVMKTGRDEYGRLPIRYLSFGENKLPLTGLLSVPFISVAGLHSLTVRLPVMLIGIALPLLLYALARILFKNEWAALATAICASSNVWLVTLSRHQHESVVVVALVIIYLILHQRYRTHPHRILLILMGVCIFVGLYTYHSAKVIMPGLLIYSIITLRHRRSEGIRLTVIGALAIGTFLLTEILAPNNRVANLSYFTSPGFIHLIEEGRRLGGSALFYNKIIYGGYIVASRVARYLSPDFLIYQPDDNLRYGDPALPLLTWIEYGLFVIGTLLILRQEKRHRLLLIWLTILALIPAIGARPNYSMTRSFPFFIVIALSIGYVVKELQEKHSRSSLREAPVVQATKQSRDTGQMLRLWWYLLPCIFMLVYFCFSITSSWRYYFTTYLHHPQTYRSWQCGMDEVAQTAWRLHDRYEKIYITRRLGQPYIYLLFYGGPYDPTKYQKVASSGTYNEYGFWEKDTFGKYIFAVPRHLLLPHEAAIIHVDDREKSVFKDTQPTRTIHHKGTPLFYVFEGRP